MSTEQLQCFLAVSKTLSFGDAAKMLKLTQPAVTHGIKALEDELSVKLFIRSTRKVVLSDEGKSFLLDAYNLVVNFERLKDKFKAENKNGGAISFGAPHPIKNN